MLPVVHYNNRVWLVGDYHFPMFTDKERVVELTQLLKDINVKLNSIGLGDVVVETTRILECTTVRQLARKTIYPKSPRKLKYGNKHIREMSLISRKRKAMSYLMDTINIVINVQTRRRVKQELWDEQKAEEIMNEYNAFNPLFTFYDVLHV